MSEPETTKTLAGGRAAFTGVARATKANKADAKTLLKILIA
jgi:hypothetical protein